MTVRQWTEQHFTVERWRGVEADVRCRLHDDNHASASINTEKRVWKCQACGRGGKLTDLAQELGIDAPEYSGNGQGRREVARYDYRDASGKVLYQKIRYEPGKDGRTKDFQFFNPATQEYKIKGLPRVPYRLPELLDGKDKDILIAEGEKCVEVLRTMGYVATCHDGGARTPWRPELNQYFPAEGKVYLIPDADNAGQAHMQDVGKKLLARGCRVYWIDLGFPIQNDHGKDIADWAQIHGRDDLDWKLTDCPEFEPEPEEEPESGAEDDSSGAVEPVKDYGHAAVLAPRFRGRFRWAPHRDSWMRWSGKVWRPEEDEYVSKKAADVLRSEYAAQIAGESDKATLARLLSLVKETCIYSRITGALNFLKGWDDILTRAEQWDRHSWLLNVGNGVLDLKTGKLGPHDPALLLTKLAPVDYDPEATGKTWTAHLERFLPNENVRQQVQRDLGMALIGAPVDELLPIWYGLGANGKSTTASILQRVLGEYAGVAAPNLLIQTKSERHPTELADLADRRIVFSSEVGQGKRLDEELVKRLTGGDTKKGRFMKQDFFEFEQTFSLFMLVNHHPLITGVDHAIWRRVRLIPWTEQIPEAERLPQDQIVERLFAEGTAVLAWIVDGLLDWQKDRKWLATEVKAVTSAYRAEQDRLGAFLDEVCEEAPHYTVPVGELYERYSTWCNEVGEDALGKTAFGKRLRQRGKSTKSAGHDNVSTWYGIRVKRSLRVLASPSTCYALENELNSSEQENGLALTRNGGNGLELVDTETLLANEAKLRGYLDDDTIPHEEREKRAGEYKALVDEIARRQS